MGANFAENGARSALSGRALFLVHSPLQLRSALKYIDKHEQYRFLVTHNKQINQMLGGLNLAPVSASYFNIFLQALYALLSPPQVIYVGDLRGLKDVFFLQVMSFFKPKIVLLNDGLFLEYFRRTGKFDLNLGKFPKFKTFFLNRISKKNQIILDDVGVSSQDIFGADYFAEFSKKFRTLESEHVIYVESPINEWAYTDIDSEMIGYMEERSKKSGHARSVILHRKSKISEFSKLTSCPWQHVDLSWPIEYYIQELDRENFTVFFPITSAFSTLGSRMKKAKIVLFKIDESHIIPSYKELVRQYYQACEMSNIPMEIVHV